MQQEAYTKCCWICGLFNKKSDRKKRGSLRLPRYFGIIRNCGLLSKKSRLKFLYVEIERYGTTKKIRFSCFCLDLKLSRTIQKSNN